MRTQLRTTIADHNPNDGDIDGDDDSIATDEGEHAAPAEGLLYRSVMLSSFTKP